MSGRKYDEGKLLYGLLDPTAIAWTVAVLTFGAAKYTVEACGRIPSGLCNCGSTDPDSLAGHSSQCQVHSKFFERDGKRFETGEGNWRNVTGGADRYYHALQRHLEFWRSGEMNDPDTGLPHVAHAMCNMMFIASMAAPATLAEIAKRTVVAVEKWRSTKPA